MKKNNKDVLARPSYTEAVEAVERGEELPTVVSVYARTSKTSESNSSVAFERQVEAISELMTDDAIEAALKKVEQIRARNTIKKGVGARTKVERELRKNNSYTFAEHVASRKVNLSCTPLILEYGRVSHLKLENNSSTFERQANSILALKKADGTDKIKSIIFEDESISAFHAKQRPEADAMIKFVDEFTGENPIYIYIEHIDRIFRNKQIANLVIPILTRQNVKLRIVDLPMIDLSDDSMSAIMLPFIIQMAEGQSKSISSKSIGGHERRSRKGIWRNSVVPYGMSLTEKEHNGKMRSVLAPGDNAHVVKEIFERVTKGDSINDIVRWLNNSKIEAPGIATIWRDTTVSYILLNPNYAGFTRHNVGRTHKKWDVIEQIIKDDEGDFLVSHEGIVTPEDFWLTFSILKSKRKEKGSRVHTHMLSGVLYCADCNAKLYGNKAAVDSYRCPDATRDSTLMPNSISSKGLDSVIKRFAKEIIADRELLKQISTRANTVNLEEEEEKRQLLLKEISELEDMIANEKRPSILIGLKAGLLDATTKLAELNTYKEINTKYASDALASPEAFEKMWADNNKTAISIALQTIIERIDVLPLGNRKKLNQYALKKKNWEFDYGRVTITWANGTVTQLEEYFNKIASETYK